MGENRTEEGNGMKKLILKTAAITLCAFLLGAALLVVILSFAAPKTMMEFTGRMGMESLSGNFAYSEYERSGDLECLARSYFVALEEGNDEKASERWNVLYGDEKFDAYCAEMAPDAAILPAYGYRNYLTGSAARMMYRLAETDAEKGDALAFALSETEKAFPDGNPVIALSAEAASHADTAFLETVCARLMASEFEHSEAFLRLLTELEAK